MADTNLLSSQQQTPPQPIVQPLNPKNIPAGLVRQRHLQAGYTMVKFGLLADRPITTTEIVLYFTTDTYVLSYFNQTTQAWVSLSTYNTWNAPTYLNSWVNYGSGWQDGGYMIDSLGIIHLRGLIKTGTIGSAAFQLPVGFRPSKTMMFSTVANDLFGEVIIDTSGYVTPQVGSNTFFSLSGITFDTT